MMKIYRLLTITVAFTLLINSGGDVVYAQDPVQLISPNSESPAGTIERITNGINGTEPDWNSDDTSISADGRFVAFASSATNLIENDTNHNEDIFVFDRYYSTIERVSVSSDGSPGVFGSTFNASISADGRFVAFYSWNTNLVEGDTNGLPDIFEHDRQTGNTERISVASDGTQANLASTRPSISADGRYIAFLSEASNLVDGDTNGRKDIFIHDRQTGITERVSVASDGSQGDDSSIFPAISADGRFVAFISYASNLVSGDMNGKSDVFVHDRQTGITEMITFDPLGNHLASGLDVPSISADGRFVAFTAIGYLGGLYPNVFVFDRQNLTSENISVASDGTLENHQSDEPSISADGRFVTFTSTSSNLAPGGIDNHYQQVYLRDRLMGVTERLSVNSNGDQGNTDSFRPSISADGRYISFISGASNFVSGDTNYASDVYLYNRIAYHPAEFSIAGLISLADNTPLQDVIVSTDNGQSITDANGQYFLSGLAVGQHTLTPLLDGYTFSPPFIQVTLSKTDVTGQNFTAQPVIENYPIYIPAIYNQDN